MVRRALRRRAARHLPDGPVHDASPLEQAVGRQLIGRYDAALQRLRLSDRDLEVARVELGLSYAEIADLSGKRTEAAARVAVGRALVALASEMGHDRRPR